MTTNLSDIDKKHLGMQSSTTHMSSTGKKHIGGTAISSKNSAGRGTGGSIDLLSGVTSLSLIKSKSIHG